MENRFVTPDAGEDLLSDHVAELQQTEKEGYELGVRKGRNALYWIAGLMVIADLFLAYNRDDLNVALVVFVAIVAGLFAGLGFLSHVKPYLALVAGVILYILLCGSDIIYNLRTGNYSFAAFSGFTVRIVFIVFLVRALPDARKLQRLKTVS